MSKSIKNHIDWVRYYTKNKRPKGIPTHPQSVYKNNGWKGWDSLLDKYFYDYKKAKKTIKKFNLKTSYEWEEFIKKNNISKHIPRSPEHYYKKNKGWKGWKDFLGTK